MKNFPDKIVIGHQTYTIHLIPDLKTKDGDFLFGQVLYGPLRIEINSSNDDSWWMPTLLHEALHVLYLHSGQNYGEEEEPTVSALGVGLHRLLTENPQLLKTLASAGKHLKAVSAPEPPALKAASRVPRRSPVKPTKQSS